MKKNRFISSLSLLQAILVTASLTMLMAFSPAKQSGDETWTLLKSQENVNVYGMITTCEDQSIYLFKVENASTAVVNATLIVNVSTEPAYGSKTFKVVVGPKASTTQLCNEADLKMPKMNKKAGTLSELTVNLTLK